MSEHKARAVRDERLERERQEKVNDRAMMLAVVAAIVWPHTVTGETVNVAAQLLDEARERAERDIPSALPAPGEET